MNDTSRIIVLILALVTVILTDVYVRELKQEIQDLKVQVYTDCLEFKYKPHCTF